MFRIWVYLFIKLTPFCRKIVLYSLLTVIFMESANNIDLLLQSDKSVDWGIIKTNKITSHKLILFLHLMALSNIYFLPVCYIYNITCKNNFYKLFFNDLGFNEIKWAPRVWWNPYRWPVGPNRRPLLQWVSVLPLKRTYNPRPVW